MSDEEDGPAVGILVKFHLAVWRDRDGRPMATALHEDGTYNLAAGTPLPPEDTMPYLNVQALHAIRAARQRRMMAQVQEILEG